MAAKKNNGFTLMEVMLAMAILAIALVSVFQSQSQSISMATDSRFQTTAALLAQSKMAEVEAAPSLDISQKDGNFGDDYPDYVWHIKIDDTQLALFKRVEVTVSNKLFAKRGTFQLVLYKSVRN